MALQEAFGLRVRETRQLQGLTQKDLANMIDVHQPDLCDLEKGRHSPTLATVEKIAKALCVSPEYLVSQPVLPESIS